MRKIIVIVSAILTLAIPAAAQDSEFARPGPYFGIGGSAAFYTSIESGIEDMLKALEYAGRVDVDTTVGPDVRGGYRFCPWAALEVQYEFLPNTNLAIGKVRILEIETRAITGNVKIFLFHGRMQPFLVAGIGGVRQEVEDALNFGLSESEWGFAARFGGGFDFYLSKNIALSFDLTYLLPRDEIMDVDGDYLSIGYGVAFRL
jgi:opacity protein-like surface antigen